MAIIIELIIFTFIGVGFIFGLVQYLENKNIK